MLPSHHAVLRMCYLVGVIWLFTWLSACMPALPGSVNALPTATLVRPTRLPTRTATPPAAEVYAQSSAAFIYYDDCFDLDKGRGFSGQNPACDLTLLHADGDHLKLVMSGNARFVLGSEWHTRPTRAQCEDAALSDEMQVFNPLTALYGCYRTGEGRLGVIKFRQVETSGVGIEWLTWENSAGMTEIVQVTAPAVRAGGANRLFPFKRFFDLDTGTETEKKTDASDMSAQPQPGSDGQAIQFVPAGPALFAFAGLADETPSPEWCALAVEEGSNTPITLVAGEFFYFLSGEGRCGFLRLQNTTRGGITFDWQSYDPPLKDAPAAALAVTGTPSLVHRSDDNRLVYFKSCIDLDEGLEAGQNFPACDFTLFKGPGGSHAQVELVPSNQARFALEPLLNQPPNARLCQSASFSSEARTIEPFNVKQAYACYQTSDGRYGFLNFVESSSYGVALGYNTFDPPQEHQTALRAGQATPAASAPGGNPVWSAAFADPADWQPLNSPDFNFSTEGGKATITAYLPESLDGWLLSWKKLADYYLQAEFKTGPVCADLDHYGLIVRGRDGDGYYFAASCDGRYTLRKRQDEHYTTLVQWSSTPAIIAGQGQVNRLGIQVKGDQLSLFINGRPLAVTRDKSFSGGTFGLFAGAVRTNSFTVDIGQVAYWGVE